MDAQVADDLVSEAFLIGWKRRDTFDPERASLKAWVFGIAMNLLRQHARSEGRRLRAWSGEHGRRTVADHVDERTASVVDVRSVAVRRSASARPPRPPPRCSTRPRPPPVTWCSSPASSGTCWRTPSG
ncbi:RNA polymerase sigma factor [Crossiella sp. NPDC003009]